MKVHHVAWLLALALTAPAVAQERRQAPTAQPQVRRPVIRPPLFVPRGQAPPATPVSNTPPVHFDLTCRNVTGLGAGWGGMFYFDCVRPDGQTEELRIARVVDETGVQIGGGEVGPDVGGMVVWLGQAEHARHFQSMTYLSISQVVQAFMLYKASHPDSPVSMSVRGIESVDPSNAGDRVVTVAYFDLN